MFIQFLAGCVTLVFGGWMGYIFFGKISPPKSPYGLIAWGLAVLIAASIGRDTRLISVFSFAIYLNYFLMSLVLGSMIGMMARHQYK